MAWEYRVVKRIADNNTSFAIHSVMCGDDGSIRERTGVIAAPVGDTPEALKACMDSMMKAFDKPILYFEEI